MFLADRKISVLEVASVMLLSADIAQTQTTYHRGFPVQLIHGVFKRPRISRTAGRLWFHSFSQFNGPTGARNRRRKSCVEELSI